MNELEQEREVIKQFLLGDLNEERRQQVEERLLTDRAYRDEILMVESELVEEYLTDKLLPVVRGKFETNYLTAPRQFRNVKLTKALLRAAQSAKPQPSAKANLLNTLSNILWPRGHNLRLATVSLSLLAVVGLAIIYNAWQSRIQRAELQDELARLNTPDNILTPSSAVPSVTLLPLGLRETGAFPRVNITPATQVVQLRVPTAANTYQNYNVDVLPIGGDQLIQFDIRPQSTGDTLILQLPARLLKRNDYLVTIRGVTAERVTEDVGEYAFRVVQE